MKHILIVDKNLGFLYWLGETLAEANHQPWPASSIAEADAILKARRTQRLDMLIVDPSLKGAPQFINRVRRGHPDLKVLAVDPLNDTQVRGVNAWRARPQTANTSARQQWLRDIGRVFHSHERAA